MKFFKESDNKKAEQWGVWGHREAFLYSRLEKLNAAYTHKHVYQFQGKIQEREEKKMERVKEKMIGGKRKRKTMRRNRNRKKRKRRLGDGGAVVG